MNKIKVIDLLNMISKGEEVPKKIRYENYIYWYDEQLKDYQNAQVDYRSYIISCKYHNIDFLNDEVEIIEDAEDIKENEEIIQLNTDWYKEVDMNDITNIQIALKCLTDRLNEVIDVVNKLNKED